MVWLAIDKIGRETISPQKPTFDGCEWCYMELECIESEYGYICKTIELPKGTIEKLLGRKLIHKESPIKINQ